MGWGVCSRGVTGSDSRFHRLSLIACWEQTDEGYRWRQGDFPVTSRSWRLPQPEWQECRHWEVLGFWAYCDVQLGKLADTLNMDQKSGMSQRRPSRLSPWGTRRMEFNKLRWKRYYEESFLEGRPGVQLCIKSAGYPDTFMLNIIGPKSINSLLSTWNAPVASNIICCDWNSCWRLSPHHSFSSPASKC